VRQNSPLKIACSANRIKGKSAVPKSIATTPGRWSPALLLAALLAATGAVHAAGEDAVPGAKPRSMQEILDGSQPADWRTPENKNLLYLDLDSGRVLIELAPAFAPAHVANIRALAKNGYWNGMSINRSQDNFVVQWGDPAQEEKDRKPLGRGAKAKLPAEFARKAKGLPFDRLPDVDGWAPEVGFSTGFPAGRDPSADAAWMAHCYGAVGAGRDMAADSSNGTELYVVTGQSPRQLDRNITVVGRVLQGMELLSVLPRGTGPLGFYEQPAQRTPIKSIKLASEVPKKERVGIEVLRTDTPLFAELVEARRNRRDEWYKHMAGHIDLCNVPLPTRAPPPRPVAEKARPKPKKAKPARAGSTRPATSRR
jgi:cyclophilin family peptidyl-prolyl cis-trans isomerase